MKWRNIQTGKIVDFIYGDGQEILTHEMVDDEGLPIRLITARIRSDKDIINQTNELARKLYELRGYVVPEGFRFDQAIHPHEKEAWRGACEAQKLLANTDPGDAIDNEKM